MAPEIPGFYYDEDKKKYFKIQPDHVAPPGAQYSAKVLKRKRSDHIKRERKAKLDQRTASEMVTRGAALAQPLVTVHREIGLEMPGGAMREKYARLQVSQLHREELHKFEPWPRANTIRQVVRNPRSGTLIASMARGQESSVSVCFPDIENSQWSYNHTMERLLFREPFRLASMSLSPTDCLLATMDDGPDGACFFSMHWLPAPDDDGGYTWPAISQPTRITPQHPMTFWGTAACPSTTDPIFAIAASEGLHTIHGGENNWLMKKHEIDIGPKKPRSKGHWWPQKNTVCSVEWLNQDVIMSGRKNGAILFNDLRTGSSTTHFQHSDSVMQLKKVDDWRIVAAGPRYLHMFDLRFAPDGAKGIKRNKNPSIANSETSQPYLTFPDFAPLPMPTLDISTDLGLLANPSPDQTIQLFSLRTGRQVPSPLTERKYSSTPSCVSFEAGNDAPAWKGPETLSMLVGIDGVVDQWSW
ncbi:hypothetical protein PENARI_c059G10211 [Penicillium arizonense]|uniref:WD40 repeat-like protein n=1 Tax=Penicillium arizonense TaxID=1835702 RepID=A0A1F5L1Q2_PENAI|nr:hypothetical protein PENARI_c059G10211 [Penicillium arizonense]OGE47153.1 hypothetical protein PENARI_c059G10211 [Penicillium arizonense]